MDTTSATTYLVRGSGPQSLSTLGTAESVFEPIEGVELHYLWVSLYDSRSPAPVRFLGVGPEKVVMVVLRFPLDTRRSN